MTKKVYSQNEVYEATLKYFDGDQLATTTWMKKYCLRDDADNYLELTPDDMHRRLAHKFSEIEEKYRDKTDNASNLKLSEYGYNRKHLTEEDIYNFFKDFKYIIPAGSVMSGLGNPSPVSLSNCWVIDGPNDSLEDIFRVCNEQSQLMKRRGGVGFDISKLRPAGSGVKNSAKNSSGAASFMDLFGHVTNTIAQNGRRGALMLSINICHPDALAFIEKKQDLTKVTGANVSVQIPDEFMEAVKNDEQFTLRWPVDAHINWALTNKANNVDYEYDKLYPMLYSKHKFDSHLYAGYMKIVKAKELWEKLIHCAWNTAEPGIIFQTRHHNYSPDGVYPSFKGSCTNPCITGDALITTKDGEIPMREVVSKIENGETVEVLTYNEQNACCEFKTINDVFLTRKNANIIEVECEDGTTLKLTPDHKVFTENRGWVEASKLTDNDVLVKTFKKIKVKRLSLRENEDVYDLTINSNHNFFANGILVHNCGEIFMHEDSCRLIHVNLTQFITEKGKLDDEKLYKVTYEAMRLGDDLVDLEAEALNKIINKVVKDGDKGNSEYNLYTRLLDHSLEGRRCGLGFTGLADLIANLGLKYDSDEALKTIETVMRIMFVAEMDANIDMAILRGTFPAYNKEVEKQGNEWYDKLRKDMPQLYERMMKYGRRNISFNTVAPTGTVSLLARTSSGIEPIFLPYYTRRVKCTKPTDRVDFTDAVGEKYTEYVTTHPGLFKWAEAKYGHKIKDYNIEQWEEVYQESPWFKSTANDIDWEKRVKLQGIVQRYITHSISSTVNLPNDVSEAAVSTIYMKAWEDNLKGITVYRDGCRNGVMVSTEEKKEEKKPTEEMYAAKRRPKTLDCKVIRFVNKGEKWVGVVGVLDGKPYEIFTGLQEKLNIPNWVEDGVIVRNKEKRKDPETGEEKMVSRYDICYEDRDGYRVCVEGLSRVFNPEFWNYGKLISGLLRHHMAIPYIIKVISSLKLDSSSINTWRNGIIRCLRKFEDMKEEITGEVCPECGGTLLREGGCVHCKDCAWSRCE